MNHLEFRFQSINQSINNAKSLKICHHHPYNHYEQATDIENLFLSIYIVKNSEKNRLRNPETKKSKSFRSIHELENDDGLTCTTSKTTTTTCNIVHRFY
ncbi:hypothetical protein DERP_005405 [Dermatophagoides pteronyssinus]|uniref:Uncharacterized protein n=1 Tax=Dermatophagoides pteronyssinus TaxID=6956 RepID=A0ABQ8JMI6_DERPT|nr:hypothetical protein DERP_005405 [Dermatophagoides pteronyssinus]